MKNNLLEECKGAKSIVISGHTRPDGDCVSSCLAMYLYLKKALDDDIKISVCLEKPPAPFACLKGYDEIDDRFSASAPDVLIMLDCEKSRLGEAEKFFENAKKRINIDHHVSNENGCGDVNYIEAGMSSTAELVYELMDKSFMDEEIAKAVYIGIVHDTGIFKYSNASPQTMRVAADLMEYGFDFPAIIDSTFCERTYVQNQLMGRALLESIMFMDGKCIVSEIKQKILAFYGAEPKDLDGIVNQLSVIKGVECAIFMYELGSHEYKVSLRSHKYVDVSKIASYFGGGGHVRAAGCIMNGNFYDVINNISKHIYEQMKELES